MDLRIRGRRACITGASKGIGLSCARTLAAEGVDVALVARSSELLDQRASEIAAEFDVRASPVTADLSTLEGVRGAVRGVREALDGIDILVNNAGAIPAGSLDAIPDEEVALAWDLKLHGYVRMARAVLPEMRARGWGRIVNVIGMAGTTPSAGYLYGGPANAALMNFTMGLAQEAARDGVLVNAVSPGPIRTDRITQMNEVRARESGRALAEIEERQNASVPIGRIGEPAEVADVVAFLSSERCTFVDGAVVPCAGGLGAVL